MKAYKLTVLVVDHDGVEETDGIATMLENARYPNRCISPEVIDIDGVEIGDWWDDHPLSRNDEKREQYIDLLFNPRRAVWPPPLCDTSQAKEPTDV